MLMFNHNFKSLTNFLNFAATLTTVLPAKGGQVGAQKL